MGEGRGGPLFNFSQDTTLDSWRVSKKSHRRASTLKVAKRNTRTIII